MARQACLALVLLAGIGPVAGCGTEMRAPDSPHLLTTQWRLDVAAQDGEGFGVRMFLDGEQVYLESSATLTAHRVEVLRPYVAGEHLIEVEIISKTGGGVATYVASCTAAVSPSGRSLHADGIPWALGVGQRLRLSVSL